MTGSSISLLRPRLYYCVPRPTAPSVLICRCLWWCSRERRRSLASWSLTACTSQSSPQTTTSRASGTDWSSTPRKCVCACACACACAFNAFTASILDMVFKFWSKAVHPVWKVFAGILFHISMFKETLYCFDFLHNPLQILPQQLLGQVHQAQGQWDLWVVHYIIIIIILSSIITIQPINLFSKRAEHLCAAWGAW